MIRQYPFPYVPNSLLALVDGTVQPAEETDPETGTFTLPADPDDAEVRAYARISPDAVPAPPVSDAGLTVLDDPEDEYEEDEDIVDAEDDEAEDDDPDAPAPPDDPE